MAQQRSATALCGMCGWQAVMTGDDPKEMGEFLRKQIIEHTNEKHPEMFKPEEPETEH